MTNAADKNLNQNTTIQTSIAPWLSIKKGMGAVDFYKKAFGVVDYRTNQPLQNTSAFNLASVTKQFICMSILMLKEGGHF